MESIPGLFLLIIFLIFLAISAVHPKLSKYITSSARVFNFFMYLALALNLIIVLLMIFDR